MGDVLPESLTVTPRRPMLRGWSHAIAAVGAAAFTVALVIRCLGDSPRLSTMLLYGLASVGLYAWSALYHVVTWSPDRRKLLQAVDHSNIFVVIAATSTAIGGNVLVGWERVLLLASVWLVAMVGVLATVLRVKLAPMARVGLCLLAGLTGLLALPGLVSALPVTALGSMVAGGALYAIGGLIYATKRPDPIPWLFGYHELFHLLVIAGWGAFAFVIWSWVVS